MQDTCQVSNFVKYKSLEEPIYFTFLGSVSVPVHKGEFVFLPFNPFMPITPEHLSYL
jgi:hypothetical protein